MPGASSCDPGWLGAGALLGLLTLVPGLAPGGSPIPEPHPCLPLSCLTCSFGGNRSAVVTRGEEEGPLGDVTAMAALSVPSPGNAPLARLLALRAWAPPSPSSPRVPLLLSCFLDSVASVLPPWFLGSTPAPNPLRKDTQEVSFLRCACLKARSPASWLVDRWFGHGGVSRKPFPSKS